MTVFPCRGGHAVAVDDAESLAGMVVAVLDRHRSAHGVTEHDRRSAAEVVEDQLDLGSQGRHRHLVPLQRVASPEARQARVDDPPSHLLGQAGALPPVHTATSEVAVNVDRPDRRAARTVGAVGVLVVRHGELQAPPVHP